MAVRGFNGTSDILNCATGGASGMTYGTAAAIVRLGGASTFRGIAHLHDPGGAFLESALALDSSDHWMMYAGSDSATTFTTSTGVWYLVVARKASGTAAARFSMYNYTASTWTHGAGGTALANWTAPAAGTVRFGFQDTDDWFNGYVAARALWSNALPWTADTTGDTAIEASGLKDSAASWLGSNPTAFWLFNQASTATPVDDLSTTGTADQVSVTGTTVVTGDDPPGFDFTLTTPGPPPVALQAAGPFPAF